MNVYALLQLLAPIPVLAFATWALRRMFKPTWLELDREAQEHRGRMIELGEVDRRPMVALIVVAFVLALQEKYGTTEVWVTVVRPPIARWVMARWTESTMFRWDDLLLLCWWATTRTLGFLAPLAVWKLVFREDAVLDFGLRGRGFFAHAWIYGALLVVVLPLLFFVSAAPDFSTYYPFYKGCSRSWFDYLVWELFYFAQFFGLEVFFRGFFLGALRKSLGSGAIFAMAVPYCMIHFGKPYLETCGAILAGIALGSLAMRTKSIYQGFLVHVTVAAGMDFLALWRNSGLPKTWWPT